MQLAMCGPGTCNFGRCDKWPPMTKRYGTTHARTAAKLMRLPGPLCRQVDALRIFEEVAAKVGNRVDQGCRGQTSSLQEG